MKESQSLPSTMLKSIEETNPEVAMFPSVFSLKQDIQQTPISSSIKENSHHSHPLEIISDSSNDAFTFICTHPQLYLSSSSTNKTDNPSTQPVQFHKNNSISFHSVKSDMNESLMSQPAKSTKSESLMSQPAKSTKRESLVNQPAKSTKRESLSLQPSTSKKRPRTTLTEEVSTSSPPSDKPFPCLLFIRFTHM